MFLGKRSNGRFGFLCKQDYATYHKTTTVTCRRCTLHMCLPWPIVRHLSIESYSTISMVEEKRKRSISDSCDSRTTSNSVLLINPAPHTHTHTHPRLPKPRRRVCDTFRCGCYESTCKKKRRSERKRQPREHPVNDFLLAATARSALYHYHRKSIKKQTA